MRRANGAEDAQDAPQGREISIDFEGHSVAAREGEPVACSLLASGEYVFARSIKYHRPRGPFCMAAACSHCLMRVDGVPNVYTCRTPARSGMRLERQNAYPSVKVDVFQAIDFLFPRGLDHHQMFAGVPVAEQVMAKVARHLAGLGLLPDKSAPPRPAAQTVRVPVAIAGGGAAGLAAATVLAGAQIPFLLLEREDHLGGRLVHGAEPGTRAPDVSALPAGSVRSQATVIGLYEDEHGRFFAVTSLEAGAPRMLKVYAERFLIAVGGHPQLPAFPNNDLPGIFAGRALSLLVRRHALVPEGKVVVVGKGEELLPLARLLRARGTVVPAVIDLEGKAQGADVVAGTELRAHGTQRVSAVSYLAASGKRVKVSCSTVAVCVPPTPSFELARQGGGRVAYDLERAAFLVSADAEGRTQARDLFVAGEVTGAASRELSEQSGRAAAQAVARELQARVAGERT